MNPRLKVAVIGAAGKKGGEYLLALQKREDLTISAVVLNKTIPDNIAELKKEGVKVIQNGDILLLLKHEFDIAVVAIPHLEQDKVTKILLRAGKYVIKEKPLALTLSDASFYQSEAKYPIFTTVQRSVLPAFTKAKKDLIEIGEPIKFQYQYCFALPQKTHGWRASKSLAGGGVIMDMGYHIIDVINDFFGFPDKISTKVQYKYQEMRAEGLEDNANISMEFIKDKIEGNILLDRHASEKKEIFTIWGSKGHMTIDPQGYQIFDKAGALIKKEACPFSKSDEIDALLKYAIPYDKNKEALNQAFLRNINNVKMTELIYSSIKLEKKSELTSLFSMFHQEVSLVSGVAIPQARRSL